MDTSKVKVSICGYDFSVVTDEDRQYILNIANKVERKVNKMLENNGRLSTASAALFAAMDYCDQVQKATGDGNNLRGQIKDYLEESSLARKQLDEAKKEIESLKREVAALRRRISDKDSADSAKVNTGAPTVQKREKIKSSEPEKESAPIQGFFGEDAFSESADASAEILSFFEQKSFADDDDE